MRALKDRSVLVTGAGSGFGASIAKAFAGVGARVTMASLCSEEADIVVAEAVAAGGSARAASGDVRDPLAIEAIHRSHVDAFGDVDVLVCCAGTSLPAGPIGVVSGERWWRAMELNVRAPMTLMNLAIPAMTAAGDGCIINIASLAATMVYPNMSAYCVSKNTLARLTEHVAAEWREAGITAFAVHPGFAITNLARNEGLESAEARQWAPAFVAQLEQLQAAGGGAADVERCAALCLALARGRHDERTGQLVDPSIMQPSDEGQDADYDFSIGCR